MTPAPAPFRDDDRRTGRGEMIAVAVVVAAAALLGVLSVVRAIL